MKKNDDYEAAKKIANDYYRKDITSLAGIIHDALRKQRTELASVAETLWDDKRKHEEFNKACLKIASLIRDGVREDTSMYPGLSLVETDKVAFVAKGTTQTGDK